MAQLTVRNVNDRTVRALKQRAAAHGRSAEAEHREILRNALRASRTGKSLNEHLLAIPAAGEDCDFARREDIGRAVEL